MPQTLWMDPSELRFSQTTAGGGGRVQALRSSLITQGWNGPPIDAVRTPAGVVVLDNTRVALAQELGLSSIPVQIWDVSEPLPVPMIETVRSEPDLG